MKKTWMILLAVAVFVSALGMQVNRAKADGYIVYEDAQYVVGTGIVFTFEAEGFRNKDLKNANIWVGSDFYDLYCWVRKAEGKILCVAWGSLTKFAGQTGIIYLGGQIFYVIIPNKHGIPDDGDQSLTCPDGFVSGADVTFLTSVPSFLTFFIEGATDSEVFNSATSFLGGFFVDIDSIGSLYCSEISEEQIT